MQHYPLDNINFLRDGAGGYLKYNCLSQACVNYCTDYTFVKRKHSCRILPLNHGGSRHFIGKITTTLVIFSYKNQDILYVVEVVLEGYPTGSRLCICVIWVNSIVCMMLNHTDISIHPDNSYLDTLEQPCRTTLGLFHLRS